MKVSDDRNRWAAAGIKTFKKGKRVRGERKIGAKRLGMGLSCLVKFYGLSFLGGDITGGISCL